MAGTHQIRFGNRTVTTGAGATLGGRIDEIAHCRHMLRHIVFRDLMVKYKRSTLGFLWTFLNPLLTIAVLIAVFSVVIRIRIDDYWAFLLSGYFVWNMALQSILASTFALAEHARLTRSVAFPQEVLILSAAASRMIEFLIEFAIILAVLSAAHHHAVPASFLMLPVLLLLQVVLVLGFMFPVATLSTLYTDVQHALPIVMMSLFYLSPVFYQLDMVPETVRPLYLLNPFAGLLTAYHQVLYDGVFPDPKVMLIVAAQAAVLLAAGYRMFYRNEEACAELV